MIIATFTILLFVVLFPVIIKSPDYAVPRSDAVVLEFENTLISIFFRCMLMAIGASAIFGALYFFEEDMPEYLPFLFACFALVIMPFYLLLRNKKVILLSNILIVFGMFGKKTECPLAEIRKAVYKHGDGMIFFTAMGKKIKIDVQMNNFRRFIYALKERHITIETPNGGFYEGW